MGYTTDFEGRFNLNKKLDPATHDLLVGLASTRRMARDIKGFGTDGEFYHEDDDNFGQTDRNGVINFNQPPRTQPSLWLQWIPTSDGMHIEWDGNEKFYSYIEWIDYLIKRVLAPRGYMLTGSVKWFGEDRDDQGIIVIEDNIIKVGRATETSFSFG
jgi:hypothetical protein